MSPLEWKFSQVFGERAPGEQVEDGDCGGRVVLFERTNCKDPRTRKELEHMDYPVSVHPKYIYKTEFQSHEPDFDYLKSLKIQEKINKIRWCVAPKCSLFVLSTNDRTIKLWKVLEHKVKKVSEMDTGPHVSSENALLGENSYMAELNESSTRNGYCLEWINKKLKSTSPSFQEDPSMIYNTVEGTSARCRRAYAHAHDYNINSISNNSDGETFLSADDLRINLWNLEINNQCFNIIDMKPFDMEDLIEVITSAEFHPLSCNLLAYSSSRGFIRLVDMRRSALCDQSARILQDHEAHGSRSFFTEIIASISDIKFAKDGRHILSRDYMNLKLWDLHMESSPIATFKMHEYLRPKLSELYNGDYIFDKFDCCLSRDGCHFASGSYSNTFRVFSREGGNEDGTTLEAGKNPIRTAHIQTAHSTTRLLTSFARGHRRRGHENFVSDSSTGLPYDLASRLTHLVWHPTTNLIVCAAANSLYMYHAQ